MIVGVNLLGIKEILFKVEINNRGEFLWISANGVGRIPMVMEW